MPFDRGAFLALAANYPTSLVRLSPESLTLLLSCYDLTAYRSDWQNDDGSPLSDSEWDEIEADVDRAFKELMLNPMLGTIFPLVTSSVPTGALECDGTTYLRTDYPALYALLDSAFIVDADHFQTPDLRGRMILGAGAGAGLSAYAVGDSGGEEAHTLITAEIPSHSHGVTDPTHFHSEGIAAPSIGAAITGVPVPSAVPGVGVTGAAATGITIQSTGGDGAHENRQPYEALRYALWAV